MTGSKILFTSIVFVAFVYLSSCKLDEGKEPPADVKVAGRVIDSDGNTITAGNIEVVAFVKGNEEPQILNFDIAQGEFTAAVPNAEKYVVNVRVRGYGLVSKVFRNNLPERTFTLKAATVVPLAVATGGTARDTKTNCKGSLSSQADLSSNLKKEVPLRVNKEGKVAGFGMSATLRSAYDFHAKAAPCNSGVAVTIPANALVSAGGSVSANVNIAVSTVDLFSSDGMPGNGTVRINNEQTGFMESFGAVSVDIYDDEGTDYNLVRKDGFQASVSFPVDSTMLQKGEKIPEEVPVLTYDEMNGEWKKEGMAKLDRESMTYIAKVSHFSAINLDIEKTNPACIRFQDDAGDGIDPTYKVELTVPPTSGGAPIVRVRDVTSTDLCPSFPVERQFALTRLPGNTEVSVAFYSTDPIPVPYGLYVLNTGAPDPILVDASKPDCTEIETVCGGFSLLNFNNFTSDEFMLAVCTTTDSLVISLAVNQNLVPAFDITDYQINVARSLGAMPNCDQDYTSTNFVEKLVTTPPLTTYQLYKYKMPLTSFCNAATGYATQIATLRDLADVVVSNSAEIVTCDI